jgi:hypothetical protein
MPFAHEPLSGGDFYTLFGVKPSHDTVLGEAFQQQTASKFPLRW